MRAAGGGGYGRERSFLVGEASSIHYAWARALRRFTEVGAFPLDAPAHSTRKIELSKSSTRHNIAFRCIIVILRWRRPRRRNQRLPRALRRPIWVRATHNVAYWKRPNAVSKRCRMALKRARVYHDPIRSKLRSHSGPLRLHPRIHGHIKRLRQSALPTSSNGA